MSVPREVSAMKTRTQLRAGESVGGYEITKTVYSYSTASQPSSQFGLIGR